MYKIPRSFNGPHPKGGAVPRPPPGGGIIPPNQNIQQYILFDMYKTEGACGKTECACGKTEGAVGKIPPFKSSNNIFLFDMLRGAWALI